ncbi:MAG: ABC transporter ATP-binding protein [Zymomonas mobilis subsp. pomaceae]|uniref:ABC transporter related protein n=1 Tax=Zymomonas mobilis subsp. pomaceae (strain ATCC 29192 / DSM 22645 / JCM 10191 / CCUG 17912 / NBRC 13757 / NCIMB 11200 / NRRL B-4491 / Barker I) TaxID=579138 RepID=F8ES83_ZYMMT|nr:ABC transporter ATP-binding protein [Zymomonas mobilis]AEI37658.1 ABC transporter related protein [Zymomonas mobilis subsp. pomaceae ATCC 29192]MDX5949025.1 ABC transporter ATP-binding protein [Zymomonas mobilis subsp. pomaceae]GEB88830.1 lipoprotein-releasing system ATP-binding protein LolD 1 [Zymomonas mobilis subsp. pomaceae]
MNSPTPFSIDDRNAVEIFDLQRSFMQAGHSIQILRGIDLIVKKGEILALLGPSGSGKSTFLQAVGLLERGFTGSIRIAGQEINALSDRDRTTIRRDYLGFVYQFHHLLPDFSAVENVMLPQLIQGKSPKEAKERAIFLLVSLKLKDRLHHHPAQLSGGEQQRVAVARALANRPAVVLADEPTGNLDEMTADVVLNEFLRLVRRQGSAAIIATHNVTMAKKMDRIVTLHEGHLIEYY